MRSPHEIPDNNEARQVTTDAIRGITKEGPHFHTSYKMKAGRSITSDAVADGEALPQGAYDTRYYSGGDQVGGVFKGPDGKNYKEVHTHNEGEVIAYDGGIPIKEVQV